MRERENKQQKDFQQQQKKQKPKEKPKPDLKLVVPEAQKTVEKSESAVHQPRAPDENKAPENKALHGMSSAFFGLLAMLQEKKTNLMSWLGVENYGTLNKKQKKTGRFRKGTMLDQKAE